MENLLDIVIGISNIAKLFLILNLLLMALKFRYLPSTFKVLGGYLIINLFTEFYSRYLGGQEINNLFLLHVYTMLEFIFWSFFYKLLFKDKKGFQKIFWFLLIIVCSLIVLNSIFLEPITGFNSNAKTLVQLILIAYAISYFFTAFGKVDFNENKNKAISFINFAVILYYSGSLFIFMFSSYLKNNNIAPDYQLGFWVFNSVLFVIFQLLIFGAIWKIAFSRTASLS